MISHLLLNLREAAYTPTLSSQQGSSQSQLSDIGFTQIVGPLGNAVKDSLLYTDCDGDAGELGEEYSHADGDTTTVNCTDATMTGRTSVD